MARADPEPADPLTVAVVRDAPPFSYQVEGGDWRGLAVEMWNMVADQLHRETRYVGMTRSELIEAVANGQARFGVGPLAITAERLERVDFSAPIYASSMAIAVPFVPRGPVGVLADAILSLAFLKLIAGLIAILVVVGTTFWVVERHRNPDFAGESGWGSGIWLSIVTMTTVGYGDKAPRTLSGRVVATIWMFTSLFLISIFTGTVATLLTIDQIGPRIEGFEDLDRVRVAVLHDSAAAQLLGERRVRTQHFADLPQALQALVGRKVDAFVYERPLMAAALKEHPDLPISIRPGTLRTEYFGIAMAPDEPLRRTINETIAQILDSPTWSRLRFDYVGSRD